MAIKRSFILSSGIGVSADNLFVVNNTNSVSSTTGSIVLSGGIGIGQSASISGRLQMFNGANYTSFVSSATGNTVYTLPATSPATGSSVLQSTSAGVLSWVPMTATDGGSGNTAQNIVVNSAGNASAFHPILFTPASLSAGSAVSSDGTISFNPSTKIINVSGLAITSTTASTSTSNGALQVAGGVGISGRLSFNQASFGTTGIATNPTMAMIGQTGDPIFMTVLEDNSIAFEGAQGQLFSITPNLSTGYIYSVNDITGIPLIRANANANVTANEYAGNFGIGLANPGYKLHVLGAVGFTSTTASTSTTTGTLVVGGGVGIGGSIFGASTISAADNVEIKSGKELILNNTGNTFYTGIKAGANTSNTTYTFPVAFPGSGTSVLQSDTSGTLAWVPMTATSAASGNTAQNVVVNNAGNASAFHPILFTPSSLSSGSAVSSDSTISFNPSTEILNVSGLAITNSTASTSTSNGALQVAGGVGISGSLNVAGNITGTAITVNNQIHVESVFGSVTTTQYASIFAKGIGGNSGALMQVKGNDGTAGMGIRGAAGVNSLIYSNGQIDFRVGSTIRDLDVPTGGTTFLSLSTVGVLTATGTSDSTSTSTGALVVTGGVGIGQSVSVGGRLQLFNSSNYTAFVSSATGNTVYTLPATSPATGSSVLQSTAAGVLSWVPMTAGAASGNTAQNIVVNTAGNANVFHPVLFTPSSLSAGSAVSSDSTISFNPSTEILNVSGLAITSGTASTNTTTGALVVRGGLGVTGQLSFAQASFGFTGITTNPTMSFIGATSASPITLTVLTDNSLNFEGSQGSVFSIDSNLSSGEIFSVSDISGLPIISASAGQTVNINEFGGFTQIGNGSINSSSTTTGSLIVSGGLGLTGNANIGGTVRITNTTNSSSTTSGAISVSGGLGLAGNAFIGGTVNVTNTTAATGVSTAALVVSGGVGVQGDLFVAANANTKLSIMQSSGDEGGEIFLNKPVTNTTITNGVTIDVFQNRLRIFEQGGSARGFYLDITTGGNGVATNIMGGSSSGTVNSGTATYAAFYPASSNAVSENANLQFTGTGISIGGNIASTSTTSGSLWVYGGVGIGQSVSVGGRLQMFNGANYTAFVSSATGNTVYTLPATSPATGSSVLQSTSGGLLSWVPMTSGSATPGGSLDGSVQYKSGSGFGGTRSFFFNTTTNGLRLGDFPGEEIPTSNSAALLIEQTISSFNGSVNGTLIGVNSLSSFTGDLINLQINAVTRFKVGSDGGMGVSSLSSSGNVVITSSTNSTSTTTGALVVTGGVGIGGTLNVGADLSISGLTTLTYTSEKLNTKTSATGTVTHDLSTGSVFYHSSISNNFTANITNVPTTNDRAIGVTLVLAQGVTPYMSTALQIDGSAQTIKWVNNITPTGTASKVDIVGFSLIRTGSAWTVLGQYSTYG